MERVPSPKKGPLVFQQILKKAGHPRTNPAGASLSANVPFASRRDNASPGSPPKQNLQMTALLRTVVDRNSQTMDTGFSDQRDNTSLLKDIEKAALNNNVW
jgi:hypothetical protein